MIIFVKLKPKKYNCKISDKLLKFHLAIFLTFSIVSFSQANIIVDINAKNNQQPTLIQHNDTATIINIQEANTEGISHNKYTQFDVDAKGVVLNNFVSTLPNSLSITSPLNNYIDNKIHIDSNELLRNCGTARIIINEVTSSASPSQLNGSIAVAGQKADIIIANPAGIACNGCGFINTHIANLSAASPLLINKSVQFLVDDINGEIIFSGVGLNKEANQSDYTTLIANKIDINAPVYADKILYAKLAGDKHSMHTASLNVSELGGMYADRVFISSAGKNIGIHNKGEIKANSELELYISGLLDSPGVISSVEYFDINSENFNVTFNEDKSYLQAHITDNVMFKENARGVKSKIKSITHEFFPKFKLSETIKIKEIYGLEINRIKELENEFLLKRNNYENYSKQRSTGADSKYNTPTLHFYRNLHELKYKYLVAKANYEKQSVIFLSSIVPEVKKLFNNSDYSFYKNMTEEKIKILLMENDDVFHHL